MRNRFQLNYPRLIDEGSLVNKSGHKARGAAERLVLKSYISHHFLLHVMARCLKSLPIPFPGRLHSQGEATGGRALVFVLCVNFRLLEP